MIAIIGGSGLTALAELEEAHRRVIRTPYGEPSGALTFGLLRGCPVVFLARHGYGHTIAPHEVNYRANVWAIAQQKPDLVVSVASVGGIRADLGPGTMLVPDQIIDYTHGRRSTFHEGDETAVVHVDFTEPYCARARQRLLAAGQAAGEAVVDGGVYAATQGPRLETAAEIVRLERDGADVVGMTGMPEAVLAREASLSYAALAVVVNHAAGRGDSARGIQLGSLGAVLQASIVRARRVLAALAADR